MYHAVGGVLDDWNFAVNFGVAVGTIAAAVPAAWLGLRASGEKQRERRDDPARAINNPSVREGNSK